MPPSAYEVGRELSPLEDPFGGQDKLYAAKRLDGALIKGASFSHCTFANVSFKEVKISQVHFLNCVFLACYFRKTDFEETSFAGCKFVDCDFPKVAVRGCDFRYCKFSGCFLTYAEIRHSLPQEPNLREDLARNLSVEATARGFPSEARLFRMCAIRSKEEHLEAAFKGESDWYRQHFDILRRIGAFFGFSFSVLNRYLWGYGEKAFVLVRNFLLLAFLVFPLMFHFVRDSLRGPSGDAVTTAGLVYYSLQNILPGRADFGVRATDQHAQAIAGVESVIGVIMFSLFASYLFRWILRR